MLSKKAKSLYLECDNTDPNVSTLLPLHLEAFKDKDIYYSFVIGQLISKYATNQFEDDWIEFTRDSFYMGKQDKKGWTHLKSHVYRLEKKGYVETKSENGVNYIRLTNDRDDIFNPAIYKRQ